MFHMLAIHRVKIRGGYPLYLFACLTMSSTEAKNCDFVLVNRKAFTPKTTRGET